jgi:hypothetical protein
MISAILMTLGAILLTYPGVPWVFALCALFAYSVGAASVNTGGTGLKPVIFAFAIFVAYCFVVAFAWFEALSRWMEIGL